MVSELNINGKHSLTRLGPDAKWDLGKGRRDWDWDTMSWSP